LNEWRHSAPPKEIDKTLTMIVVAKATPELRGAAQGRDRDRGGRSQTSATLPECESRDLFGGSRNSLDLKDEIEHDPAAAGDFGSGAQGSLVSEKLSWRYSRHRPGS
jgi:hypothetical protein